MSTRRTRYPTEHAGEQFRVRASSDTVNIMTAWKRGSRVKIPPESPVPSHDEARYDARGDVVIFRREETLTTCYGVSTEHVTNIYGVAVALAVDAQYGTSYTPRLDPTNLEETDR